jgi:hypothetical protein
LAVLDINDFPSFGGVPRAVVRIAEYILHAATRAEIQRIARQERNARRRQVTLEKKLQVAQPTHSSQSFQTASMHN